MFYGWVVVAVSSVVAFGAVTFFNPVLGVFFRPLSDEFGWSRAQISLAVTIGSASAALASPAIGWTLDRWGGRWVMAASTLMMGGALFALNGMNALWQFYVFYSLGRALAQGVINSASFVSVANWFVRRRPLAAAIVSVGQRAGLAALPLLAAVVIEARGWRAGFAALAVVVLVAGVVPPLLFMRRRPEDHGLLPDGEIPSPGDDALPDAVDVDWSLRESVRTRAYWLVGFAIALMMASAGSINLHQIPHLEQQGLTTTEAASIVAVFSLVAAGGGLLGGAVATRLTTRTTLAVSLAAQAGGVLLLIAVSGLPTALVYAVVYGICFGASVTLSQVIYADYFGRRSLGVIRGSFQPVQLAFNAAGPWIAGFWFDQSGSYESVFTLFAVLFAGAALFVALSPVPRARPARERTA
ncbi:MAG: MFS transporter [Dehalococcoidia bacterium]